MYEPDRDTWRSIARAPIGMANISAASSGTTIYVLTRPRPVGEPQLWEYSLSQDRWARLPAPPHSVDTVRAVGTDRLVAYAGAHAKSWTADQFYDIASRTWSSLPRDPLAPSQDRNLLATDTGDLVLLAVGPYGHDDQGWAPWGAAQWKAKTKTWERVATSGIVDSEPTWWWEGGRIVNPSTQTVDQDGSVSATGGILDPVTKAWKRVPDMNRPSGLARVHPQLEAAGSGKILDSGQILDVASRVWTSIPQPPEGFPTQDAAAIIIDDQVITFGGASFKSYRGTLTNDTWVLRLP
ncbi:Kelch repeat-containing protein [Kineosporia babensis]|uniref:Galactose oxidase n=1 Tax=Kineosporia babensis TaxID=499548 RepID=A0A9X1NHW5_9ACTN|nr:hypothetical protein [Kineosporia babensis]MCD5314438.1 hypothetical protein [Kineosporia babensis]